MISSSTESLLWIALAPALLWAVLSLYTLADRLLHDVRYRGMAETARRLKEPGLSRQPLPERMQLVHALLRKLPERSLQRLLLDPQLPRWARDACSVQALLDRPLPRLLARAAAAHSPRTRWRRISALSLLVQVRHARSYALLQQAIRDPDPELRHAAVALLGDLGDMPAAAILVDALQQHDPLHARVASKLDHYPLALAPLLLPLSQARDGSARAWAALLLGRYPHDADVAARLLALTTDADASVRKAAAQSLASLQDPQAAQAARRLLADPVPFVRAHAARAVAAIEGVDGVDALVPLLGDSEWWVRQAAKESLERIGEAALPALETALDASDRFARNGAAEVIQALGVIPRLLQTRKRDDHDGRHADALLQRIGIAAGHPADWLAPIAAEQA